MMSRISSQNIPPIGTLNQENDGHRSINVCTCIETKIQDEPYIKHTNSSLQDLYDLSLEYLLCNTIKLKSIS